jgi:O-antigen/teichoic acid export membrane protein
MSTTSNTFSETAQNAIPWVVSSKALLFIIYFCISILTVRQLGTSEYGIYVICKSIAEVLILICTMGMTASYLRFIPELIIHKNKAGINRLIGKSCLIQVIALSVAGLGLFLSQAMIEAHFSIALNGALFFTFLLVIFEQAKININAILTALFKAKQLTLFSSLNGFLWLFILAAFLHYDASVSMALAAPAISYALIYIIALISLYRYFKSLNWRSPSYAIGKKRVLNHSGSIAVSTLVRLLMLKYTELFFLGGVLDSEAVGLYDLAFSLPMMVIVFIPAATQELFTSGFSEAYVKNKNCLPELIRAFYKILILITIPISVFGFMFSGDLLVFCYGEEVRDAYELTTAFCLLHLLPLISTPLSVAVQAKEKVLNMFPTLLLQLTVNILLDYLFIIHLNWGVWGAFMAIFLTFVFTIPIRLYIVSNILGGIFFPGRFFLRIFGTTLIIAFLLRSFFPPESLITVFFLVIPYLILSIILGYLLNIIRDEDKQDLSIFLGRKLEKLGLSLKSIISKLCKTKSTTCRKDI